MLCLSAGCGIHLYTGSLMKRSHDECVDAIKKRCIDRLSVKRKLTFSSGENKKIKTEYHQGLHDGKKITEEACYYFFTYSYNARIREEVEKPVTDLTEYYERIISELQSPGHGSHWVY